MFHNRHSLYMFQKLSTSEKVWMFNTFNLEHEHFGVSVAEAVAFKFAAPVSDGARAC